MSNVFSPTVWHFSLFKGFFLSAISKTFLINPRGYSFFLTLKYNVDKILFFYLWCKWPTWRRWRFQPSSNFRGGPSSLFCSISTQLIETQISVTCFWDWWPDHLSTINWHKLLPEGSKTKTKVSFRRSLSMWRNLKFPNKVSFVTRIKIFNFSSQAFVCSDIFFPFKVSDTHSTFYCFAHRDILFRTKKETFIGIPKKIIKKLLVTVFEVLPSEIQRHFCNWII